MNTFPAFSIFFHVATIDFDFTQLREDQRHAKQKDGTYLAGQYRILESYPELKDLIELKFNDFFTDLYGVDAKNKVTTSWMTSLTKGDSIHIHNHRNCQWSGVLYYGEYDDNSCPLKFENPLLPLYNFYHRTIDNCPASSDIAIPPRTGQIIFFPAFVPHYSNEHKSDITRQSLAFNLIPTAQMISGDSSLDYGWITNQNL